MTSHLLPLPTSGTPAGPRLQESRPRTAPLLGEHEPLVSVVTPAYNEEMYIRECIESVLNQRYRNWEYIIVNNCSTDRTSEIAHEYARRDPRIRVFDNTSFSPVVANYNIALRQISPTSAYCKIVGADDWLYPDCLSNMVSVGEKYPSAVIIGAYYTMGNRLSTVGAPFPNTLIPGREACRQFLSGHFYFVGMATPIMYRSRIVRERTAFFNEAYLHSDLQIFFELLESDDFGFSHDVLSHVRERPDSLTAEAKKYNRHVSEWLDVFQQYGKLYLTAEEYSRLRRWKIAGYYKYLGETWLSHIFSSEERRKIVAYHRKRFSDFGDHLSISRILLHAALSAIQIFAEWLR